MVPERYMSFGSIYDQETKNRNMVICKNGFAHRDQWKWWKYRLKPESKYKALWYKSKQIFARLILSLLLYYSYCFQKSKSLNSRTTQEIIKLIFDMHSLRYHRLK